LKSKNKHITLIGINFYPEDTAIGLYSTQLMEYLKEKGYEISVITGFPYYPAWEIKEDYKKKPRFFHEKHKGISIYRYKQYVPDNPGFLKRIIHLVNFTLGSYFNLKKIKHTDLVLSIVPFTTDIWLGKKLAKKHNAKLWVHIQDFEFDAAIESKLSGGNNFIFKQLFRIEQKLLTSADVASTISHAMLKKLKTKTNHKPQSYLLPNWVDIDFINSEKAKRHPYIQKNKFNILYSGNIGNKQDWNLFINLAKKMEGNDNIVFIVVGDGANKQKLIKETAGLKNIFHYEPVPYKELPDLLCSADLHILFQKNDVIDTVMPSKILGMMSSAKPSVIAGNRQSEVAEVLQESKGGFYFENNQIKEIIDQINQLQQNKELATEIGKNAREYISKNFSKEALLISFEEKIKNLLEK